jgi:hypothetical protein
MCVKPFLIGAFFLALTAAATNPVAAAPIAVTVAGSFQSEVGCGGDWDPACGLSGLAFDFNDQVWHASLLIPTGSYEYKVALDNSWTENYGANAVLNGANIPLTLGADTLVTFYYSDATHWVTSNVNSVIAVAPGSFQSELGCSGDWDPSCLRSWLQDPDGDGVFLLTVLLPPGAYETKAALNEEWTVNYGVGGVLNGANIPFVVPATSGGTEFRFDSRTSVLTVRETATAAAPEPASMFLMGLGVCAFVLRRR